MRVVALLSVCSLAAAQQQIPLVDQVKGWFAKATASVSSAAASASSPVISNPLSAGAAALAATQVQRITLENHKSVLTTGAATASPGIENWMIFLTGGNKTCYGLCNNAEEQWNRSVALLTSSKNAPHLGLVDCEVERVLCHAWAAGPPAVYYMQLPQPAADQSQPSSTVYYHQLNRTSVTAKDIAALHIDGKYKNEQPYTGLWHPLDSPLAKTGANIGAGYVIWAFGLIPSWAFMIGVSMISRTWMSQRMVAKDVRREQAGAAPPAGAPVRPN